MENRLYCTEYWILSTETEYRYFTCMLLVSLYPFAHPPSSRPFSSPPPLLPSPPLFPRAPSRSTRDSEIAVVVEDTEFVKTKATNTDSKVTSHGASNI